MFKLRPVRSATPRPTLSALMTGLTLLVPSLAIIGHSWRTIRQLLQGVTSRVSSGKMTNNGQTSKRWISSRRWCCVVRMGVVRMGVVRLGVVRLGVVRMGRLSSRRRPRVRQQ
jgi:hypothetical protein